MRDTLIKLEALQEIKEQQSLDNIPQTVLFMAVVEDESSSISMVNLVPDDSAFDKLANWFMAFRDNNWIIVRIIGYPRQYPTFDPDDFGYSGS